MITLLMYFLEIHLTDDLQLDPPTARINNFIAKRKLFPESIKIFFDSSVVYRLLPFGTVIEHTGNSSSCEPKVLIFQLDQRIRY